MDDANKRSGALGLLLAIVGAAAGPAAGAAAGDEARAWENSALLPAETDFLERRLKDPQNHFQLNGREGFVAGREFYQVSGETLPFLWPDYPLLRYGTDRAWQSDSVPLAFRTKGGNEMARDGSGHSSADMSWEALETLRLHAGWEQNETQSGRTFPGRRAMVGADKAGELAWYGSGLPLLSQVNLGAAYKRLGATMAAQYNQGWWWTTSPATGRAYPWEGFNADFLYKIGDDFGLNLVEQQWDSPIPHTYYKSHWRRSEITMSFPGASQGSWTWRFDIGYQRRAMNSDSAFRTFEEKTYPVRFRYRQDWAAPDSLPLRILSQGNLGLRDRMFTAQHSAEFRETFGTHRPMQFLRGYYRRPQGSHIDPKEGLRPDTTWMGESAPGDHARGFVAGAEYREVRKRFQVGIGGDYAMEWELPRFETSTLDTAEGIVLREGRYRGSDHALANASGRVFASGGFAEAVWHGEAGLRRYWGRESDSLEFRPSPWWIGAGGGWTFPSRTRLAAQIHYLGPKEVRGWGPVFKVPTHWENHFSASQTVWDERLKIRVSALHAFGEDIREHPNGNPIRFRLAAGLEGGF